MKTVRKNAYDVNTWQQVVSKIKNAEADSRSFNEALMLKLKQSKNDSSGYKNK